MSMEASKIRLIISREFYTRVRKTSFWWMTILGPLLTAALMIFAVWLSMKDQERHKIMVVDDNYPAFDKIQNEKDMHFFYSHVSLTQAQEVFFDSDYTCILYLPKNILSSNMSKLYVKKMPSATAQRRIEKQIEKLIEEQKMLLNNIDPQVYRRINTNFHVSPYKLQEKGGEIAVEMEQAYVGYVFAMFIYIFISIYAVQVMRGVMEEKTNRIVEVIICSVKPFQLMMGKIIGVVLVGLFQLVLWAALTSILFVGLKAALFNNYYDPSVISQVQMTPEVAQNYAQEELAQVNVYDPNHIINRIQFGLILPLFFIYFIGGYLLYASLFAAIGAMVDQETDTQQFILPVTIPLILGIVVSNAIIQNPESTLGVWFSMIPFTSPIVMMVRVAIGVGHGVGLPWWQLIGSLLFLILGFVFTTFIGAKLYRASILMYGKKATYRDIWKWLVNK